MNLSRTQMVFVVGFDGLMRFVRTDRHEISTKKIPLEVERYVCHDCLEIKFVISCVRRHMRRTSYIIMHTQCAPSILFAGARALTNRVRLQIMSSVVIGWRGSIDRLLFIYLISINSTSGTRSSIA